MEQLVTQKITPFNILSLDGGGSKGIYTIGILRELECLLGKPLHEHFDLIFGTSTGAIITALIGLGYSSEDIEELYLELIPKVMRQKRANQRSSALKHQANLIFGKRYFQDFKTDVGIVTTHSEYRRPMIFKSSIGQAHGRKNTFSPGFGATISEAVIASCAAFPYFNPVTVNTENQGNTDLLDGGFVANNPALFAITDATRSLKIPVESIRLLSLGVGEYPKKKGNRVVRLIKRTWPIQLIETTLDSNTNTIEILRNLLFPDISAVRINDSYSDPKYATDLLEFKKEKLEKMKNLGRESFALRESDIQMLFNL